MAMVPKFPQFNPSELQFDKYLSLFQANLNAYDITDEDKKKNFLIISLGSKVFDTLSNLTAPELPSDKTYNELVQLLKTHYVSKPSYHRSLCLFQRRVKNSNESLKDLYADLKRLAKDCNFGNTYDARLRDQLFMAIDRQSYFKFLMAENLNLEGLTSSQLLNRVETLEKAHVGEEVLVTNFSQCDISPPVNKLSCKEPVSCKHCGYPHLSAFCKFKHLNCRKCGLKGHLERVCRAKQNASPQCSSKELPKYKVKKNSVKVITRETDDEGSVLYSEDDHLLKVDEYISIKAVNTELYYFQLNNDKVPLEVDSGATVSVLTEEWCKKIGAEIKPSNKNLKDYGGHPLNIVGETRLKVLFNNFAVYHVFYVACSKQNNLCGRDLMKKVGIGLAGLDESLRVNNVDNSDLNILLSSYSINEKMPISGVEAKIYLKDNAIPKFIKARQVPLALKDAVGRALDKLVEEGKIEPVAFSEWAAPIVPVLKKGGDIRICVDFKYLNTQINIEKYPLPKLDEMLAVVNKSTYFSKLDLANAYLQIPVCESDQSFLVISTEKGLFKYKCLPFGLASAPGIFQRFISQLLCGIEGVVVYLDDILVCATSLGELEKKLRLVLDRLSNANVKLNVKKCELNKSVIEFLGYEISAKGLSPSPTKVRAIVDAPEPKNLVEVQSFLGLVTYYSRFIPKFSDILSPLYDLTKKNVKFVWCKKCQIAFDLVKKLLCSSTALSCFTGESKVILEVDASPIGLGAVLLQLENENEKPVAFASKKLSSTEQNYSQTDREAFALVFGVTKFKYFLLGRNFELRTDHKPLLGLFGKSKSIPKDSNARLTRWSVLLSQYSYDLVYKSGKSNVIADTLSRLPVDDDLPTQTPVEYIKLIENFESLSITFETVQNCTKIDPVLKKLLSFVKFGWPSNCNECNEYAHVKNDLTVYDNVILFQNRILIPTELRSDVLRLLHSRHNGIVATKAEARQSVWWPNLNNDIEDMIRSCKVCAVNNSTVRSPSLQWSYVGKPWSRVHIDYCELGHEYFLILMDAYSKFIDVHLASSMTSSVTIELLRKSFANFGIPDTVVSDNAPNLVSKEMREFYLKNGISLINPSPYHPASNGMAERAVRTFKEGMKKMQNGTLNTKLCRFLYTYRRTVHSVTKESPAERMFGRKFKSPLDILKPKSRKVEEDNAACRNSDSQVHENKFCVGQAVFAKNFSSGPPWLPAVVLEVKGVRNYVVRVPRKDGDLYWRRHADHLKVRSNVEQFEFLDCPVTNDYLPNVLDFDIAGHDKNRPDGFYNEPQKSSIDKDCTFADNDVEPVSSNLPNEAIAPSPCISNPHVPILRRSTRISKPPDRLITTM